MAAESIHHCGPKLQSQKVGRKRGPKFITMGCLIKVADPPSPCVCVFVCVYVCVCALMAEK